MKVGEECVAVYCGGSSGTSLFAIDGNMRNCIELKDNQLFGVSLLESNAEVKIKRYTTTTYVIGGV